MGQSLVMYTNEWSTNHSCLLFCHSVTSVRIENLVIHP